MFWWASDLACPDVDRAGGVADRRRAGSSSVLAASWYAFTDKGILLDATFPLIGGFVAFSALAMYQFVISDREKRMIRRSFSRYVAPSVLSEIDRRGHSIDLGGTTGEVTVLFCDIRNFTPMAATMSAQDLVSLLNELFTDLSEEILSQSGTIDKYIGDEIMAFWNAPLPLDRHQFRACTATLNMRLAMRRYNERRSQNGLPDVAIGMGLDCGPACVGNIGSRHRFNYNRHRRDGERRGADTGRMQACGLRHRGDIRGGRGRGNAGVPSGRQHRIERRVRTYPGQHSCG